MKKPEERIYKYSAGYNILRAYAMFIIRNFYRRIQVAGQENIPYGSRFIITPNHQNALMDAMAILFAARKRRIVFMARADIFRKKSLQRILTYFKMLPIYRMRDGVGELQKNEEVFEHAVNVVSANVPLCLMPEGNHGDRRRLRKFVKGAFRIAFRAQEKAGDKNNVYILPAGIDFQHYQKINQDLLIIFGKPVNINEFIPDFKENQPKGINSLRDKIAGDMKKLMIHIENEELYDMYQDIRHIWNGRMRQLSGIRGRSLYDAFRADKIMIRILDSAWEAEPDTLRVLSEKTADYMKNLKTLKMRNWIFARKGLSGWETTGMILRILITFPLALYGIVNNILPCYIPVRLTKRIKDPQFVSSFKFVITLLVFPAFYIVQTMLAGFLTGSALIAIVYLVSLPVFGYYSLNWTFWVKKLIASFRYKRMRAVGDKVVMETTGFYVQIMQTMEKLCSEYMHIFPENKDISRL